MTLIASVSGIRGTLGGRPGEGLTPVDVLRFSAAFGNWLKTERKSRAVIIGRDARPSGLWCTQITAATLQAMGFEVLDLGLSTTPTVQMEILATKAVGGIMISASHNASEWNALKLLNADGEFASPPTTQAIVEKAGTKVCYADLSAQGSYQLQRGGIERHIKAILSLPLVDKSAIKKRRLRIAVDAVNSTGGISLIPLLEALGVKEITKLNCEPTGHFSHNPEPLPENISQLCSCVREKGLDLGLAVDPDVDRLAIVTEEGEPFGEEYTLVAVADYVLSRQPGPCVSNLSSSRALQDIAARYGQPYYSTAVGEVYVVERMRDCGAVIGGEGNGGVIYPELHAGRDALLAAALFLSLLCRRSGSSSSLRSTYPSYYMKKCRIALPKSTDIGQLLKKVSQKYSRQPQQSEDGLRINFPTKWVHLRPSNTEPILRIYTEGKHLEEATQLADNCIALLEEST